MTFDIGQARAFLATFGAADSVNDFRAIHDTRKDVPGVPLRGTLDALAGTLEQWNVAGYGIFVMINETDGQGLHVANVQRFRANFIDVDGDPDWSKWRAVGEWLAPSCYVMSSPGKFHAYWAVEHHADDAAAEAIQRKLVTKWGSDHTVVDAPRVMRLPGSLHMKNPAQPSVVTFYPGRVGLYTRGMLEWQLAGIEASAGAEREALGNPAFAAPSLAIAVDALGRIDPGTLDRGEWLKITAAFKASVWQWGEVLARMAWDSWCATYPGNDLGENEKLWRSIASTKTGWSHLARVSGVQAELMFGDRTGAQAPTPGQGGPLAGGGPSGAAQAVAASQPGPPRLGVFLTAQEQARYFEGCFYVKVLGRIFTPDGLFQDAGKFNADFGGKVFIISDDGSKTTDEPWKAATRGQVYQVPKVHHTRFLPELAPMVTVADELGRLGINTYKPANIVMTEGDASPFINHLRALIGNEADLRILLNFMAHCVQRPGVKALWAPVIQSAEGAGKGLILAALKHAIGSIYVHDVNAKELSDGGGKFNSWLRNRLLIIANEIKVDETREMLEVLKPLITESRVEIQSKGVDQMMEDNVANWIMFTNFQNAVPINKDSRRYAVFFSPIQTAEDIIAAGMGGEYFPKLFNWMRSGGAAHVAWFLMNFPIDPEYDPAGAAHRAPVTTSTAAAIVAGLGRIEATIQEAIDEGTEGFRGGYMSAVAVGRLLRDAGIKASPHVLKSAYKILGYVEIGRAGQAWPQDDFKKSTIYAKDRKLSITGYPYAQGWQI